jgi:hypothetical protein
MAEVAKNEQVDLSTIPISPDGAMTDATNGATNGEKSADNGEVITVFDDPSNFNVKHQLQHTWTLWFTKPPSGKQDWNELLKEVISFNSVEEFWGIYVSTARSICVYMCHATVTDRIIAEQHHPSIRARAEVRLSSLQAGCPT